MAELNELEQNVLMVFRVTGSSLKPLRNMFPESMSVFGEGFRQTALKYHLMISPWELKASQTKVCSDLTKRRESPALPMTAMRSSAVNFLELL